MAMTRRDVMLGAAAALLVPGRAEAGLASIGGPAFGSSWRATLAASDAQETARMIGRVLAGVDDCFSPYRPHSALSLFNTAQETGWQVSDAALVEVAKDALEIAGLTDGFFDPTVGPMVGRYGFGPITGRAGRFSEIEVDGGKMRKSAPDLTLDLCGIAKGHALDRVIRALAAEGVESAIIDVGGEVRSLGLHPDGRPWSVAIADPERPGAARRILAPGELAVATSGHAANGVRRRPSTSHIIDPLSRRPADQGLLSVTVLDRSAARADALATALCAAGREAGPDLARRLNISALFLLDGGEEMTGAVETHVLI